MREAAAIAKENRDIQDLLATGRQVPEVQTENISADSIAEDRGSVKGDYFRDSQSLEEPREENDALKKKAAQLMRQRREAERKARKAQEDAEPYYPSLKAEEAEKLARKRMKRLDGKADDREVDRISLGSVKFCTDRIRKENGANRDSRTTEYFDRRDA